MSGIMCTSPPLGKRAKTKARERAERRGRGGGGRGSLPSLRSASFTTAFFFRAYVYFPHYEVRSQACVRAELQ